MSEFLDLAKQITAEAAAARQTNARLAAVAREAAAAKQRLSRERIGAFVGLLVERDVQTIPLYVEEFDLRRDIMRPQRVFRAFAHLGDGWLVRKSGYEYDEGTIPGLFVVREELQVYECNDPTDTQPHRGRLPAGEHAIALHHIEHGFDGKPQTIGLHDYPSVAFADEAGRRIIGQALADRGITS